MADLVTLDYVKGYLGVSSAKDDALLSSLITAESGRFEGLTGGEIITHSVTETWSGDGSSMYFPSQRPVVAVSALSVDGVAVDARASVTGEGYVQDGNAILLVGSYFTRGVKNCTITYTAGYGATAPSDVQQAVAEMVATKYRGKDRINVSSASMAGESVSYLTDLVSEAVRNVIDRYQRVRV